MMQTECGKEVHWVGVGVCGQDIVQVKIGNGSKKDHDAWRLGRVIRKRTIIMYGKNPMRFKLSEEMTP